MKFPCVLCERKLDFTVGETRRKKKYKSNGEYRASRALIPEAEAMKFSVMCHTVVGDCEGVGLTNWVSTKTLVFAARARRRRVNEKLQADLRIADCQE